MVGRYLLNAADEEFLGGRNPFSSGLQKRPRRKELKGEGKR